MTTDTMKVPYTYLRDQFHPETALFRDIMRDVERVVAEGDFTLGKRLKEFEEQWAEYIGVRHAIGVASGTDALFLILKALGLKPFSCVATVPNTFVATLGAILANGCQFTLVDVDERFLMPFVTTSVDVVLPVHWAGDMHIWPKTLRPLQNGLKPPVVVEDACQAIGAYWQDPEEPLLRKMAGSMGLAAAFSLHPLKNVNIWGDGGVVTTDDDGLAQEIRLLRNHGLSDRDTWVKPGYNSRLDTIQAVVASHGLRHVEETTARRVEHAQQYDVALSGIPQVWIPPREMEVRHVYHLYQIRVHPRDELLQYLLSHGVDAKVHYPKALHLQPAMSGMGFHEGDFPMAESFARDHITLPIHQYLERWQIEYVVDQIYDFYKTMA